MAYSSGVPGRFTCFRVLTKNSSLCVYGHFMSYCPKFCCSRAIYEFERFHQKVVILAFYGRSHELLPIVLGFQGDLRVGEDSPKSCNFGVLWSFS